MKWLLLMLTFSGPTSPDRITFEWHNSRQECEDAFKDIQKNSHWYKNPGEYVCIPFEK